MNKIVSLALLVLGVVLFIYAAGSDFSRFFTGVPTDKSIWLLAGGALAAVLGAGGLFRGSPSR